MEHTGAQDTDKRVLLVDDDPVILDILGTGLTRAGYHVDACGEARSAFNHYQDNTPDIAVLDVGLPDMSGTDLARELLRAEYRPILILSNYKDQEIVRDAITSGVSGYLVKPLSVEQLIPSLETSLSRYRDSAERVAVHLAGGEGVWAGHLAQIIDGFPFALLIVDEHHHPIYRNAKARRLMDEALLNIDPAGRLRSRAGRDGLVPVLDQALGKGEPSQWGAVLLDDSNDRRLHAWAAPLDRARVESRDPESGNESLAAVAVFDAAEGRQYPWEAMKALYGLTRKETMLINGLLQGLTLEEYCQANFVTDNTVRTHLKSVYRKTGTHRQSDLVRLFSSMFMPADSG